MDKFIGRWRREEGERFPRLSLSRSPQGCRLLAAEGAERSPSSRGVFDLWHSTDH